ncbi:MAG: hypothetical protein ACP5U1_11115 [Desulfomonilaceae bacterium]
MLKKDNDAGFTLYTEVKKWGYHSGKPVTVSYYRFSSAEIVWREISQQTYESILLTQMRTPVLLAKHESKAWWMFQNQIYKEDDNLEAEDVKSLILDLHIRV